MTDESREVFRYKPCLCGSASPEPSLCLPEPCPPLPFGESLRSVARGPAIRRAHSTYPSCVRCTPSVLHSCAFCAYGISAVESTKRSAPPPEAIPSFSCVSPSRSPTPGPSGMPRDAVLEPACLTVACKAATSATILPAMPSSQPPACIKSLAPAWMTTKSKRLPPSSFRRPGPLRIADAVKPPSPCATTSTGRLSALPRYPSSCGAHDTTGPEKWW
eukprot:scaffold78421_cov63-Phaeocystis_antarctica.AAC.6